MFTIGVFFYFTGESLQLVQHKLKIISPTWGNQFSIRSLSLVLKKLKDFDYSEIHKYLKKINGWEVKQNDKKNYYLEKNFKFKNFLSSQKFINFKLKNRVNPKNIDIITTSRNALT